MGKPGGSGLGFAVFARLLHVYLVLSLLPPFCVRLK